jgi:hypothetical protein
VKMALVAVIAGNSGGSGGADVGGGGRALITEVHIGKAPPVLKNQRKPTAIIVAGFCLG